MRVCERMVTDMIPSTREPQLHYSMVNRCEVLHGLECLILGEMDHRAEMENLRASLYLSRAGTNSMLGKA